VDLSDKDAELIASKVAEDLRKGLFEDFQKWSLAQQKTKFELTFGINCESEMQRDRMRDIVKWGDKSLKWWESPEGQQSMKAIAEMANVLGTEKGAEQIQTLKDFAAILNDAHGYFRSRIAKAMAVGLIVLLYIGLQSTDAFHNAWKAAIKFFGTG
jgi:hypothetical protein